MKPKPRAFNLVHFVPFGAMIFFLSKLVIFATYQLEVEAETTTYLMFTNLNHVKQNSSIAFFCQNNVCCQSNQIAIVISKQKGMKKTKYYFFDNFERLFWKSQL